MLVKPTDRIWTDIQQKIDKMFEQRVAHAENWANYGVDSELLTNLLTEEFFPTEEYKMVEALGDKFFTKHEGMNVRIRNPVTGQTDFVYWTFSSMKYLGRHLADRYDHTQRTTCNATLIELMEQRRQAIVRVNNEKDGLRNHARQAFYGAPSVNSLIKAWPGVVELLPDYVIERVNTKVERAKPSKVVIEDLNQVNAALLRAKIAA